MYIGTTTSAHYDDARLVLEAGKHCLVEKVCPTCMLALTVLTARDTQRSRMGRLEHPGKEAGRVSDGRYVQGISTDT